MALEVVGGGVEMRVRVARRMEREEGRSLMFLFFVVMSSLFGTNY